MATDLNIVSIEVENAAYVAPSAIMFGKVRMEEGSSIWTNSVIRSEHKQVQIGRFSNIQDLVMIHVGARHPTIVGDYCSVTHRAVLHGCTIEDYCLIGIGSIIMDGAVIGKGPLSWDRRERSFAKKIRQSPTLSMHCSTIGMRWPMHKATTGPGLM